MALHGRRSASPRAPSSPADCPRTACARAPGTQGPVERSLRPWCSGLPESRAHLDHGLFRVRALEVDDAGRVRGSGDLLVFHACCERPVVDIAIEIAYRESAAFQLFFQADLVTI